MGFKKGLIATATIVFYSVVLTSCGGSRPVACIDPEKVEPGPCTREYRPVCGCDGKTYGNSCEAGRVGIISWKEGSCQ